MAQGYPAHPRARVQSGELRQTGISAIGDIAWGTHFCQFYEHKQDLIEILVPYIKAGLENNEFCMWVASEPLPSVQANAALAARVDNLEKYIANGQLEVLEYSEWYTLGAGFQSDRVLQGWVDRLEAAARRGFDGLRLTGNTSWLEKPDWHGFSEYEATVDAIFGQHRMLGIYTYMLSKCSALQIMDVISNHSSALVKRAGKWQVIQSSERKKVEANLHETEERVRLAVASTGLGTWDFDMATGRMIWSDLCKRHYGLPPDREVDFNTFLRGIHRDDRERVTKIVQEVLRSGSDGCFDAEYRTIGIEDGKERWIAGMGRAFFDQEGRPARFLGTTLDITERKRAEAELRENERQLRSLAGSLLSAQEEERRRISRELHDDLTQRLAGLAMELGTLATEFPRASQRLKARLGALQRNLVEAAESSRHMAYQLHPAELDDLGLATALRAYCEDFGRYGITAEFDSRNLPESVNREVASCLYRIAQESLRNVAQHANSRQAWVTLEGRSDCILLQVRDDGVGFPVESLRAGGGLGLVSMQERVRHLNGSLAIQSKPEQGTVITVEVPLPKAETSTTGGF